MIHENITSRLRWHGCYFVTRRRNSIAIGTLALLRYIDGRAENGIGDDTIVGHVIIECAIIRRAYGHVLATRYCYNGIMPSHHGGIGALRYAIQTITTRRRTRTV